MRLLFLAAYVANLILACVLQRHPAAPASAHPGTLPAASLIALDTLLLVAILLAPRLLRVCPARWVGIPHADYWLQPAHRDASERKIRTGLLSFGTVTFLILLLAGSFVLRFQQTPQQQPSWWELRGAALLFFIYSV